MTNYTEGQRAMAAVISRNTEEGMAASTLSKASTIQKYKPDLVERVARGTMPFSAAYREAIAAKEAAKARAKVLMIEDFLNGMGKFSQLGAKK